MNTSPIKAKLARMSHDDGGSMTVLGLFIFMAIAMTGAIALDFGQLYSARTQLQVLADQVGHAAIYQREDETAELAIADAVALANATAAISRYGEPIKATDIKFGTFDKATNTFTEDAASKEAVRVVATFAESRGNEAQSYLFRLIGVNSFDIVVESVWEAYYPACLNEGLVAVGMVDVRSNNGFGDGFCLHSNDHIEMQNSNGFGSNATVSMPDKSNVISGGFESNPGLEDALKDGFLGLRVLNRLETFREGLLAGDTDLISFGIVNSDPINVKGKSFDGSDFVAGNIYNLTCPGQRIKIDASAVSLDGVVIVTDCALAFSGGSLLQNTIILTTDTSAKSISSPSNMILGLNDGCAPTGGATLLTYGGMSFPASLNAYGGTLIARNDIEYAANANGMQGVSMVAGGIISGTSNMGMGACPNDMNTSFKVPYFRMAR